MGVAVLSYLSWYLLYNPVSALMWAFVYSILIGNVIRVPPSFRSGIDMASKEVLRFGIACLGVTVSALAWLRIGLLGVGIVLANLSAALFIGIAIGKRVGLSDALSVLIGVGTSICGASAIASAGPALRAKEEEMGMALACITIFGLVAMFLYPFLFLASPLDDFLEASEIAFGFWSGIGIHETAQVVAAGYQVSKTAGDVALLVKSIRIFMIGPITVMSAIVYSKMTQIGKIAEVKLTVPKFAIAFIALSVLTTIVGYYNAQWIGFYKTYLTPPIVFLLAMGFAGVGMKVQARALANIGWKAFAVGLIASVLVSVIGLFLVRFIWMAFH